MPLITKTDPYILKVENIETTLRNIKWDYCHLEAFLTVPSVCVCVMCFFFRGQMQNSVIEQAEFFMQEIQTCLAISRANLKALDGDNRPFFNR